MLTVQPQEKYPDYFQIFNWVLKKNPFLLHEPEKLHYRLDPSNPLNWFCPSDELRRMECKTYFKGTDFILEFNERAYIVKSIRTNENGDAIMDLTYNGSKYIYKGYKGAFRDFDNS